MGQEPYLLQVLLVYLENGTQDSMLLCQVLACSRVHTLESGTTNLQALLASELAQLDLAV